MLEMQSAIKPFIGAIFSSAFGTNFVQPHYDIKWLSTKQQRGRHYFLRGCAATRSTYRKKKSLKIQESINQNPRLV